MTYRRGVGLVLFNREKKIWTGMRLDQKTAAWQMPQGGIDEGELPLDALQREIREEVGISFDTISILSTTPWLRYDFPVVIQKEAYGGLYKGQEQKWFLAYFKGQDRDINIVSMYQEFSAWQWQEISSVIDHIVPFKKDLYREIFKCFASLIKTYNLPLCH